VNENEDQIMDSLYNLDFILAQQAKNPTQRKDAQQKLFEHQIDQKPVAKSNLSKNNLELVNKSNAQNTGQKKEKNDSPVKGRQEQKPKEPPKPKQSSETNSKCKPISGYSQVKNESAPPKATNSVVEEQNSPQEIEENIVMDEEVQDNTNSNPNIEGGKIKVNKKFNLKDLLA
jgi:hypothetical protein